MSQFDELKREVDRLLAQAASSDDIAERGRLIAEATRLHTQAAEIEERERFPRRRRHE